MGHAIREFYESNPLMISSPFGGVDGVNEALLAEALARLGLSIAGTRVLDVGCGRGLMAEWVRREGGSYFGADFVASGAGFPLALADAQRLPFADAAFDTVFCIDAMEHFPDIDAAAAEFRRVLKPGGAWFLSAPNYGNVAGAVKWAYEALGLYRKHTWAPFRRWQPQELEQPLTAGRVRRAARRAGFQRVRHIGHAAEVGLGLFPWVDHPRMPEALQFRLQRVFARLGPAAARIWPGSSLHLFYRIDA